MYAIGSKTYTKIKPINKTNNEDDLMEFQIIL